MIPMISSTNDMSTITKSNMLKKSNKYIKLDANVFNIISAKNNDKNAKSILDNIKSDIPNISAIVNQNRINNVYIDINIIDIVSKNVDSNIFKHPTFNLGIANSFFGALIKAGYKYSFSFTVKCINLLTTIIYTRVKNATYFI
jgi:hypothetical protein